MQLGSLRRAFMVFAAVIALTQAVSRAPQIFTFTLDLSDHLSDIELTPFNREPTTARRRAVQVTATSQQP